MFSGLKRADAHLLGAFLTGRLPATLILGPELGPKERAGVPRDTFVWPKD